MMKNEKPGGHGERSVAVGVLDMALWDAVAKAEGVPLWRLLADRYNNGNADKTAWVYAAGGYYYPEKDIQGLQDEMKHYLDLGYSTVKMKIGGVPLKDDLKRIEAALKMVGGKGENLCVDVNGRYDLDEALACGDAIAPYNLQMVRGAARSARLPAARGAWRRAIAARSRPARTCSRCRTRAT